MTLQAATEAACKVCRKPIPNRRSSLQTRCIPCVIAEANAKDKATAKAQRQAAIDARKAYAEDRRQTRAKLEAFKPRSKWMAEAQQAFNAWVRARDAHLPCVSCGRHHEGQYHAGHYLTVGARPELRFDPLNVHKQCSACNTHLHGNLVLYRVELVRRIGTEAVEKLEGPHPPMHYSVDELCTIKHTYRVKARELQKETV